MHPAAQSRFDLTGRVVWVVGATGLLGSPVARALAEHGAHVVVSGRDGARCDEIAAGLVRDGLLASAAVVDVGDEASVERTADAVIAQHSRLDACVNLAFTASGAAFDDATADDWDRTLHVSGTGAFLVARAAGQRMTDGGSIVQFSSMYGLVSPDPANYPDGMPVNPPDYGFAKAGILQLVRYQAVLLGPRGVRVNAVVPGPFPGPAAPADGDFAARLTARVPLGRLGDPGEVVGAVVFLCSDASAFVTGTALTVDGGWTAW
jgi:NAD(P)-dependent dehydrogenase (short-subunit alcohol dehydrogenase family)